MVLSEVMFDMLEKKILFGVTSSPVYMMLLLLHVLLMGVKQ